MKILIIIPAFNAESTLPELIHKIKSALSEFDYSILIVNDGSSDQTKTFVRTLNTEYIEHTTNQGKGAALKTGFRFAIDKKFDCIVTIDADLQHDPLLVSPMIDHFKKENADILIGTRIFSGNMSWDRRFSNYTTSVLMSIRTGIKIGDSQSGFRIIKTAVLHDIVLKTNRYETESELLIKLAKNNARFTTFNIPTLYNDEKSYIRRGLDTFRFIRMYFTS